MKTTLDVLAALMILRNFKIDFVNAGLDDDEFHLRIKEENQKLILPIYSIMKLLLASLTKSGKASFKENGQLTVKKDCPLTDEEEKLLFNITSALNKVPKRLLLL